MKRHGNLWGKITDLENIKLAHRMARKGKSFYTEVKMVNEDIDKYAKQIQELLVNKTFTTSAYETEKRSDGRKIRTIYKLPYFPDRIVQHALLNITGPLLIKSMIRDTYQSILGRGTSDAARRVKELVRTTECPRYAIKVDIHKYYPSVDNELMKQCLRRHIKCKDTLWLFDDIVNSTQGLPIGNYTSQHLGNIYLNQFDWWMKQIVKPAAYFRYCDDIVIFSNSKEDLQTIRKQIEEKLTALKLKLKPNWTVYDVHTQGVDFVGYVFKPTQTRLRANIAENFKETCKRIRKSMPMVNWDHALSVLMAYKGWVKRCNGRKLWRTQVACLDDWFPKQLRGAV